VGTSDRGRNASGGKWAFSPIPERANSFAYRDMEQHKRIVSEAYAGVGWRVPQLLEQAPALTISERWDASVAIATVRGEIDIDTVGTLSEHLGHLAGKNPQRLVIDLAGVSFIDSSGLAGLVRFRKALPPGCRLSSAPRSAGYGSFSGSPGWTR
jgi:ABC-type transporter Mla MlaB component